MLFGRNDRKLRRILVVEDEPLVAFDNEHLLRDSGYEVVATVDHAQEAIRIIDGQPLDLVLTDINLAGGDGIEVAHAAARRAVKVLFVTGNCPIEARSLAVGCLAKPYGPRDFIASLDAIEAALDGRKPRRIPPALSLYIG